MRNTEGGHRIQGADQTDCTILPVFSEQSVMCLSTHHRLPCLVETFRFLTRFRTSLTVAWAPLLLDMAGESPEVRE